MGGSRRRLKKTQPKVQVGLKKRKASLKTKRPVELIEDKHRVEERLKQKTEWEEEGTLHENYARNRLVLDPNQGFGRNRSAPLKTAEERRGAGEETYSDDDELRVASNLPRKSGKAPPKRLTSHQREVMQRLIERHGDDAKAMMLDRKLNPMQHSEGKLREYMEAFHHWRPEDKHDFRAPNKPYKKL